MIPIRIWFTLLRTAGCESEATTSDPEARDLLREHVVDRSVAQHPTAVMPFERAPDALAEVLTKHVRGKIAIDLSQRRAIPRVPSRIGKCSSVSPMESHSADALADKLALLTNHVRRRLRYFEAIGDVQPGDLDPEDLVDGVYLDAGQRLQQQASGERDYRWLRRLADEVLERAVRQVRAQRRSAGATAPIIRSLPELVPDPNTPIPEEVAADAGFQRALARLFGQLPDELREPFLLVVADGYRIGEVAALEHLLPEEVRRRVAHASLLLRERLAQAYGGGEQLPLERLFRLAERIEPTTDAYTRARQRLSQPPAPTAPPP
jgi:DNA-directed RNA polymerase specialized sigma24 family protein